MALPQNEGWFPFRLGALLLTLRSRR